MIQDPDHINKIAVAIKKLSEAITQLKELGVIRSSKYISDYAEWFVKEVYNGDLAPQNQKGWDVKVDSRKFQVKVHAKSDNNTTRSTDLSSGVNNFDELALVILGEQLQVREFYLIPSDKVKEKLRGSKPSHINWADFKDYSIPTDQIPNGHILSPLIK